MTFKLDSSEAIYRAINSADAIKNFVNPFTLSSSSSDLSCSFNGGCNLNLKGTAGIQTMLKENPKVNYIKVCEQRCEYDDSNSSAGDITCKLPSVPTTYSNQNFQIGRVE
jgi:hypothetical protein